MFIYAHILWSIRLFRLLIISHSIYMFSSVSHLIISDFFQYNCAYVRVCVLCVHAQTAPPIAALFILLNPALLPLSNTFRIRAIHSFVAISSFIVVVFVRFCSIGADDSITQRTALFPNVVSEYSFYNGEIKQTGDIQTECASPRIAPFTKTE